MAHLSQKKNNPKFPAPHRHHASTAATNTNVHDELRKLFARTPDAKAHGYKAGDFSCNTGSLRCPTCDGTGVINLDVQFLPDVDIPCPDCGGSRYSSEWERAACG